ncbi:MAG: DUF222 domain-containing protein, partial [Marmoricola sp.]
MSMQEGWAVESLVETVSSPLLAGVEAIEAALEEMAGADPLFLGAEAKGALLLRLARLETRLVAVRLRVMAVCDEVALAEGARDVAALVTHHTRTEAGANRRDLALAQALDLRWHLVAAALSAGEVNLAQAHVITHALEELP